MRLIGYVAAIAAVFALSSCQSKYEAAERLLDLKAKQAHPKEIENVHAVVETSDNFEMKGKATFTLVGKAPQQPYQHTPIPDGGEKVKEATQSIVTAGAAITAGALIHSAGKGGDTTNITNNNGAESVAEGGAE